MNMIRNVVTFVNFFIVYIVILSCVLGRVKNAMNDGVSLNVTNNQLL